ncbi:MAG: hypothetical protein J6S71_02765 [Clostridia bacterium]|nr:hypothetical protein [Clostridia bacterium]
MLVMEKDKSSPSVFEYNVFHRCDACNTPIEIDGEIGNGRYVVDGKDLCENCLKQLFFEEREA